MKIWVDAQLPQTLAGWLNSRFEVETLSLKDLGLRDARNIEIFEVARSALLVLSMTDALDKLQQGKVIVEINNSSL
jgi:predicted nuclease of predicted toxin-antitoxin system